MPKLLLISDSDVQTADGGKIPAIERFDDARYRVLREYVARPDVQLGIIIVSTKYGLIGRDKLIGTYRKAWTYDEVDRVLPALSKQWAEFRQGAAMKEATDLMIGCLDEHLYALRRLYLAIQYVPHMEQLHYVSGGRGQQAQQIADWLRT